MAVLLPLSLPLLWTATPRHCKAGVINHGPLLGWAIQKGHKIEWSNTKNTWMPMHEGTPEDGIGNDMGAQLNATCAACCVQRHAEHRCSGIVSIRCCTCKLFRVQIQCNVQHRVPRVVSIVCCMCAAFSVQWPGVVSILAVCVRRHRLHEGLVARPQFLERPHHRCEQNATNRSTQQEEAERVHHRTGTDTIHSSTI